MIMRRKEFCYLIPFSFVVLFLTSCGAVPRSAPEGARDTPPAASGSLLESGIASWYGPGFHGRQTANGERYNMNDLTAAHRTMPFNTLVQVENVDNGKSVVVRINDRGPYVGNRVIDLSRRAAREIDMIGPGTANVQLRLVREGDRPITQQNTSSRETFTVQVASFETEQEALAVSNRIEGSKVEKIDNTGNRTVYRVYYGIYPSAEEAQRAQQHLSRQGHNGFVKQVEN